MNWEELLKRAPKLEAYIKHMPPDIKARSVRWARRFTQG